mgnify:CR=1 FL=1
MSYIGQALGQGQAERFLYTATGTGTAVTADDDGVAIGYTVGQVSVYLNGVKQVIGSGKDVTATDGSTITFLAAYAADDVIEVIALSTFSPADTVPATGGTFTGNVTGTNLTLSGNLTVNGTTVTIDAETLLVEDKNIEMGSVDTPTDTTADGGGITLKGTTDKTITWENDTNQWNVNQKWTENAGSSAWHRPLTTMLGLG